MLHFLQLLKLYLDRRRVILDKALSVVARQKGLAERNISSDLIDVVFRSDLAKYHTVIRKMLELDRSFDRVLNLLPKSRFRALLFVLFPSRSFVNICKMQIRKWRLKDPGWFEEMD